MSETLEQVIADLRKDVKILDRHGAAVSLAAHEAAVERIARAAEPFTTFLSESDAVLRSGHTVAWLRARFAAWERQGHARKDARGRRTYREAIVPARVDLDAVRKDAERTARRETAA